jgi:hypothetical protein
MGVMSIVIYDSSRVYYMNTGSSPIAYASPSNPLNLSTIVPQTYIQMVMQGSAYLAVLMDNGVLYTYRHNNLGSGSDGASATYYLDAVAGYYYAIFTGKNLAAYYLDSNGNRVSIPTYRWDINPNWVIFRAPATTRIYLTTTNTPLSTLNTASSWFPPAAIIESPYYTVTITYPSPWSQTKTFTVSPFTRQDRIARTFDGANVLVIYTIKYVATPTTLFDSSVTGVLHLPFAGTHTMNIVVRAADNTPNATVYATPSGWLTEGCMGWTIQNEWYTDWYTPSDGGQIYTYFLAYQSGSGSGSNINIQAVIYVNRAIFTYYPDCGSYLNTIRNWYGVSFTISPMYDASYSSFSVYSQVNRVITAATGDRIYVVGSLDSLPTA